MKSKLIPVLDKNKKLTNASIKYENVPHTNLMINIVLGSDEESPEYMISHRKTGWAVLQLPKGITKKKAIAVAEYLWKKMPARFKEVMLSDHDGYDLQMIINSIIRGNDKLRATMSTVLRSAKEMANKP